MSYVRDRPELLLGVFIMMVTVFVYQFTLDRFDLGSRRQKFVMSGLFAAAEMLIMAFPFYVNRGVFIDLRDVPIVLGTMYGGPYVGGFVTIVFAVDRVLHGGIGIPVALVAVLSGYIVSMAIRQKFMRSPRLIKIILAMGILTAPATVAFTMDHFVMHYSQHAIDIILASYIVRSITLAMTTFSMEILSENVRIRDEVRRAEKFQLVGELAASVAHEIRNPMTVVKGFLQLLIESRQLEDTDRTYVDIAQNELGRAETIISEYLAFAKPQINTMKPLDICAAVHRVIEVLHPYSRMRSVEITHDLNERAMVRGDSERFLQCLLNMVKNGIESMPSGGPLYVQVTKIQNKAVIEIVDRGIGMDQWEVQRLGTPFYSTKTIGTGLGLMSCYRTIHGMGGQIEVGSRKGKGTTFRIFLPTI